MRFSHPGCHDFLSLLPFINIFSLEVTFLFNGVIFTFLILSSLQAIAFSASVVLLLTYLKDIHDPFEKSLSPAFSTVCHLVFWRYKCHFYIYTQPFVQTVLSDLCSFNTPIYWLSSVDQEMLLYLDNL